FAPALAEGTLEVAELGDHHWRVWVAFDDGAGQVRPRIDDGEVATERLDRRAVLLDRSGRRAAQLLLHDLFEDRRVLGADEALVINEEGARAGDSEARAALDMFVEQHDVRLLPEALVDRLGVHVEGFGVEVEGVEQVGGRRLGRDRGEGAWLNGGGAAGD